MRSSIFVFKLPARTIRALCAIMFLLALLAPGTMQLLSASAAISGAEKRTLAPLPAWPKRWSDWNAFTESADAFLRDHFGLRAQLLTGWNLLKYVFRYDPRVAIGRDGWLYYSQYLPSRHAGAACERSLSDAAMLADRLDRLAAYAAVRDVQVLFAIAPDKETIYPEYAPARLRTPRHCDIYSHLMRSLEDKRHLKALDLRPKLNAWKTSEQVYFKTDTHWSDIGLWRVSGALLEAACPDKNPCSRLPRPSFSARTFSGDLVHLLGLVSVLTEDYVGVDVPAVNYRREVMNDRFGGGRLSTEHLIRDEHPGRTLHVIGDSFGKQALRYLIVDQSVARASWSFHRDGGIDFQSIVAAKPDAILIVIAERELYRATLLRSLAARRFFDPL